MVNVDYATQIADQCMSIPLEKVPVINKAIQDVYLKAIPSETIPEESLTNHSVKSFQDFVAENQHGTFHKAVSILLLVTTVAILATAILSGVFFNPAFFMLCILIIFPPILAKFSQTEFSEYSILPNVWLPFFSEIDYIIAAFKELDKDKFKENLVTTRNVLELLIKNETDITAYINAEKIKNEKEFQKLEHNYALQLQPQKEFHRKQIIVLDHALKQLEIAKKFLEATKP